MSRLRRHLSRFTARLSSWFAFVRRVERRELSEFRRWLENTNNLIHLSIVLFVPLLIGTVTLLSGRIGALSFLLFPPLASGTYTLFSDPEGRYSSPTKFVASLTVGAVCGLVALTATEMAYGPVTEAASPHPESAALAVFLTSLVTWGADIEAPSAFSTALLTLVSNPGSFASQLENAVAYVVSIFLASLIVAGAFVVWRGEFYERRARYLYETVRGDDHVLVPMRGDDAPRTALFGARLAAAHDAGKVVLLGIVEEGDRGAVEVAGGDIATSDGAAAEQLSAQTDETVSELESCAADVRTRVGVPCEVVVAAGDPVPTTLEAARNANCDLVVTPYEEDRGLLSDYVRGIFRGPIDAVAFRSVGETRRWRRILVLVSRPGDTAHAMIDFATRLAGRSGVVSVTTCISSEVERRRAESRLANFAETADGPIETRVSRSDVQSFISANAGSYDLLVLGSSQERSAASRFVAPPTFERIHEVECDVAVFDRGDP